MSDIKNYADSREVMELAFQAGTLLLENGAEISRVEETMNRICRHYGVQSNSSYVLSNGIFATTGDEKESPLAKVQYVLVNRTNLEKVTEVNSLSRDIEKGKYTVSEAKEQIENIKNMPPKKTSVQLIASGVGSAVFSCLAGGGIGDCMAVFISGVIVYLYILKILIPHLSKTTGNIIGGLIITMICGAMYFAGVGAHFNYMIIGSIYPLIPGVAFINAIRDIADENYISGIVRMLDTILVFFCIAVGVGIGISVINYITGGSLI